MFIRLLVRDQIFWVTAITEVTDVDEVTSITDIGEAFGVAGVITVRFYWGRFYKIQTICINVFS